MKSNNRYPGIDPIIIKQIKYHAWRLKQISCFTNDDIEDIEQELLCEVFDWLAKHKHNNKRSSLATFVDRIVSYRSNNMINRRLTLKRGTQVPITSLNSTDDFNIALIDKISAPQSNSSRDDAIDMAQRMNNLPEQYQQTITLVLQGYTIVEIASLTGKSRPTIYRILEEAEPYFVELLEKPK